MISFRYHLVSLTAVFLALALGIAMGVTVIDKATVDLLQKRLHGVEIRVAATNRSNDTLRAEVSGWNRFAEHAGDQLTAGRLAGVPVVVMTVDGADAKTLDGARQALVASGANLEGTLTFRSKLRLARQEDVTALAAAIGISQFASSDELRQSALSALARGFSNGAGSSVANALGRSGFIDWSATPGKALDFDNVPLAATRYVFVSGPNVEVPTEQLGVPFVLELSRLAPATVVATDPIFPPPAKNQPEQKSLVQELRVNRTPTGAISTVDDGDDFRGRIAIVLAVKELLAGKSGHYGFGAGASRVIPAS